MMADHTFIKKDDFTPPEWRILDPIDHERGHYGTALIT